MAEPVSGRTIELLEGELARLREEKRLVQEGKDHCRAELEGYDTRLSAINQSIDEVRADLNALAPPSRTKSEDERRRSDAEG